VLKTLLLVAVGLAAGLAVAAWWQPELPASAPVEPAEGTGVPAPHASSVASASRIADLETQLAAETAKRAELEQRVAELGAAVETLQAASGRTRSADRRGGSPADAAGDAPPGDPPPFRGRFGGPRNETPQQEVDRLVAAGFSPDRAAWIQQRSAQLVLAAMQAQYDARRDGRPFAPPNVGADRTLRSELGDADYERYLQAQGRPTSVAVQNVLTGSPAEKAGFEPGDQIVNYGGQRVFDMGDLNALTLQGTPGESVTVDVQRNGSTVQLTLPRGPLGIGAGPAFFRRGP
jgi:hypothetical protein